MAAEISFGAQEKPPDRTNRIAKRKATATATAKWAERKQQKTKQSTQVVCLIYVLMECSIYRVVAVFAWGRPYPGLWRLESDSCCDSWSFNWCNLETATLSLRGSWGIISRGSSLPSSLCTRQQIWVMYIRLIVPSSLSGIITSSTWHEISELRWDERASIDRRVVVVFFSSFCFLFLLLLLLLLLLFFFGFTQ